MQKNLRSAFNTTKYGKDLLAFVHIEKAAGTTFIHILRNNYFLKYCDVVPLSKKSKGMFRQSDLKKVLSINPALECIGGHSIKPFIKLYNNNISVKYITLLRDPIKRYLSHYMYWIQKLKINITFQEFLKNKKTHNFQTKKIAGSEDLIFAKNILDKRFFLAGIVEEFDQFLVLLRKKIVLHKFYGGYRKKNTSKMNKEYIKMIKNNLEIHKKEIYEANQVDIMLYRYVKEDLIKKNKDEYGISFEDDLKNFQLNNIGFKKRPLSLMDYIIRKIYYKPAFSLIRKLNGLPIRGSY